MSSLRRHEGYLLIDHSASPGTRAVPEGTVFESPTVTCAHCQTIVILNAKRTRSRGYCANCDAYICDPCHGIGECTPFLKVAEQAATAAFHADPSGLLIPRSY